MFRFLVESPAPYKRLRESLSADSASVGWKPESDDFFRRAETSFESERDSTHNPIVPYKSMKVVQCAQTYICCTYSIVVVEK